MNLFDIVLIVILSFFVVKGLVRGIILEVLTLAGMIAAYILALRQVEWAAALFAKMIEMPPFLAAALGFSSIFIAVIIAFRILAVMLHKMIKKTPVNALNRGGGVIFGGLKGLLIASLAAHLVALVPIEQGGFAEERKNSWLLEPAKSAAPFIFNLVKTAVPQTKPFSDELQEGVQNAVKQTKTRVIEDARKKIQEKMNNTMNPGSMEEIEKQVRETLENE